MTLRKLNSTPQSQKSHTYRTAYLFGRVHNKCKKRSRMKFIQTIRVKSKLSGLLQRKKLLLQESLRLLGFYPQQTNPVMQLSLLAKTKQSIPRRKIRASSITPKKPNQLARAKALTIVPQTMQTSLSPSSTEEMHLSKRTLVPPPALQAIKNTDLQQNCSKLRLIPSAYQHLSNNRPCSVQTSQFSQLAQMISLSRTLLLCGMLSQSTVALSIG